MKDFSKKIWAEKYRPVSFDTYIFSDPELKKRCMHWKETEKVFPSLTLAGIQGTGKSTLARVLINEFDVQDADTMFVDGSKLNKVDDIRNKVIPFASMSALGNFKVIVIEEAHRLTKDAQSALYETIERTSDHVRFIFTTNYPKKIDAPILSRCPPFIFDRFDEDATLELLDAILSDNGVETESLDEDSIVNLEAHIKMYKPDLRAIITSVQHVTMDGKIGSPDTSLTSSTIQDWENTWSKPDIDGDDMATLFSMCYLVDNTNYEAFYTTIYTKGLHHFGDSKGDAVVHISDFLARAMNQGTQGIQSIHMEALLHTLFNMGDDE